METTDPRKIPKKISQIILSGHWENNFSKAKLARGKALAKMQRVEIEYIEVESNDSVVIYNEVRGSRLYTITVFVMSHKCFGYCSCPDQDEWCKHISAVFHHVRSNLINLESMSNTKFNLSKIDLWLNSLTEAPPVEQLHDTYPKNYKERLIYLYGEDYLGYLTLTPRKAVIQKDGSFKLKDTVIRQNLTRETKPKYITANDLEILRALDIASIEERFRDYTYISKTNPSLPQLLLLCAVSTRLCIKVEDNITPIHLADPRCILPSWKTNEKQEIKPSIELIPHADIIIAGDKKIFIDTNTCTIGEVTQTHSNVFLENWLKGPPIPQEKFKSISNKLSKIKLPDQKTNNTNETKKLPKPQIPALPECKTLSTSDPIIHLTITRRDTTAPSQIFLNTAIADLIIAIPSFIYHGHDIPAQPYHAKHKKQTDQKILTIPRNKKAENLAYKALSKLGLFEITSVHPKNIITKELHHALIASENPHANMQTWVNLIANTIPELEKKGWKITIHDNLNYSLIPFEDHFETLEEDESKNDWFRFDFGIQHNNKKISLIPALAAAIASDAYSNLDLTNPDLHIPIPIDDQENYINFPAARFKTILDKVSDLFNHINNDGKIEIPTLRAASLADDLNLAASNKTLADLAKLGKNLKNITSIPSIKPPANLNATLRDYQLEGFCWLQFLAKHKLHGILADDMGLGKTIQTLTHILKEKNARRNKGLPSLVIAPTSVIPNWITEAQKFTPSLKILLLHGPSRHQDFEKISKHNLIVTSYALLQRDIKIHSEQKYHLAILDESQNIKNAAAKTTKAASKLQANHRICLSGTPMENHLGELWSCFNFLMPGLLQSREAFNKIFRSPIEKDHSESARTSLSRRVTPLILRRTKDKVAKELPPKTIIPHLITLNSEQIDLYESIRASMDKRIRDAIAAKGLAKSQIVILDALLKLRQVCCHPQLLKTKEAQKIKTSAKLDFLVDLLGQLLEEERSILIFSQFTTMLSIIEKHLKKNKISFSKITGATKDRKTPVDEFQSGKTRVFLISLKAGGTGLNLTAADTVIHFDPWWNPAAENQATDRAYRIGQKKPVFVHKLICQGTIEEQIQILQQQKAELVESLLSKSTNKTNLVNQESLKSLLAPIE